MTTLPEALSAMPHGCVLAYLGNGTAAAVPYHDELAPVARRLLHGQPQPGDREAIEAWLAGHPQFAVECAGASPVAKVIPVPVSPAEDQAPLWTSEGAA